MNTNLMTYLAHCHDPSQPYEIIDEHADYHYELSSSNFNLINMSSQTSPGMVTVVEPLLLLLLSVLLLMACVVAVATVFGAQF